MQPVLRLKSHAHPFLSGALLLVVFACCFASAQSYGAEGRLRGAKVTELFSESRTDPDTGATRYSGCLVALDTSAVNIDASCTNFVTLACEGLGMVPAGELPASLADFQKAAAQRSYSNAQLAYVANKPVDLWIMGDVKSNGYCLAAYVWLR